MRSICVDIFGDETIANFILGEPTYGVCLGDGFWSSVSGDEDDCATVEIIRGATIALILKASPDTEDESATLDSYMSKLNQYCNKE